MDEDTLIIRAKRGNKKAIEMLVSQFQPMVGKVLSKFHYPREDYEDMLQEGNIGILQAIQEFVPTSHYSFSSFVYLKIQNNLYRFVMRSSLIPVKYGKAQKQVIVKFIGDILQIKTPDADDAVVYGWVIQELINELFSLNDFRRFLVSRKFGLFGHFPLTIKGLRGETNKRFHMQLTESQVKNRVVYAVRKLRKGLLEKGITGSDIWCVNK